MPRVIWSKPTTRDVIHGNTASKCVQTNHMMLVPDHSAVLILLADRDLIDTSGPSYLRTTLHVSAQQGIFPDLWVNTCKYGSALSAAPNATECYNSLYLTNRNLT